MNKKMLSMVMAGMFAVGFGATGVQAADPTATAPTTPVATTSAPAGDTTAATVEAPRKSMVLTMNEVAAIFLGKYANSAIHSIELDTDYGRFAYEVEGYTTKHTYTIKVDVITGKILKEEEDGREKNIPSKIFNPLDVIDPHKAEAIARAAVGDSAISKSWELKAEDGKVTYEVKVINNDEKVDVILNALDGTVITKSVPEKIVQEEEDDDTGWTFHL